MAGENPTIGTTRRCVTCGHPDVTRYCPECGERRIDASDYALRRFVAQAIHSVTNLDSRLLASFHALIVRPGQLTADYLSGRRQLHLQPVQLFIVANVIYFLVQSATGSQMVTTPLRNQLEWMPYSSAVQPMVEARLSARGTTMDEYAVRFDDAARLHAKSLVIVMAPILALVMWSLFGRARRHFVEHLVFAVHFYAWYMLVASFVDGAVMQMLSFVVPPDRWFVPGSVLDLDTAYGLGLVILSGIYLYAAARRVYGESRARTTAKCVVAAAAVFPIVNLYRLFLFFFTFAVT